MFNRRIKQRTSKGNKMEAIYTKARARVNLNLEVIRKREDNYHDIKSIFQKINLYDELRITKTKTNQIEISSNIEELKGEQNIIYKAYEKLKEKSEKITGIKVALKKNIPMQAGLAGGSADCASFLLAMNRLFCLQLSQEEIEKIGKSLGADVVPCLYNKAVLVEGIGEKITPIKTDFKYYIVIIKPKISCNTKEMYQRIDKIEQQKQTDSTKQIIQGLEKKQIEKIANFLYNRFEEVMENKEEIQQIKQEFKKQGALRKFANRFRFLYVWYI